MIPAILNTSGNVTITVLAAVFVAVFTGLLTAFTTNKRLDKQLAHDRELKDVEELRSLLDDAAGLVADAMYLVARVTTYGVKGRPEEEIIDAREAMATFVARSLQATHMEQRIALRLGVDNEVRNAFTSASEAMSNSQVTVNNIPLSDSEVAALNNAGHQLNEAQNRFLEASRRSVGSQFRQGSR